MHNDKVHTIQLFAIDKLKGVNYNRGKVEFRELVRRICWRFYDSTSVHKFQQKILKGVEICMLAQWIGDLIGQMHNHRVTKTQLAEEAGVTREYASMVLNGHRCPNGAESTFTSAFQRIVNRKEGEKCQNTKD